MLLSSTCKIEISLLMAMILVLLSFLRRVIGFSLEVMSILDISGGLVKKIFMFNITISYVSIQILLVHVAEVLDIIKKRAVFIK